MNNRALNRISSTSGALLFAVLCANAADVNWVTSWATAQQLAAPINQRPQSQPAPQRRSGPEVSNLPATFADQTLRMVARVSVGGKRIRITLSNMLNAPPLEIGAATVALRKSGSEIVEATNRPLTFSGRAAFTLPPGAIVVSDPVSLDVAPSSDLAVSLYLPRDTGAPTSHTIGLHSGFVAKGNMTAARALPDAEITFAYAWLTGIEVEAPRNSFTVVALGDSITDGYATTRDADQAWPTLLAKRFQANKSTAGIAVINQGISGNQVLRDGAGLSALGRLERDVLGRPGVKWVVLLEGINDINIRGRSDGPNALTAEELIWGYQQILARCHSHGIKVLGATIMPEEGVPTASERGEQIRQAVNTWTRTKGNFDAIIDFDSVVRDPQHPARLKQEFDPGDHIHPNDAGNQAMANAFNLAVFK